MISKKYIKKTNLPVPLVFSSQGSKSECVLHGKHILWHNLPGQPSETQEAGKGILYHDE